MKNLLRVLGWITAIVTALLVIGAFLPGTANISRSVTIHAPASTVFGVLNNLKTYNAWMPWNQKDSTMVQEFGQITEGKGAFYTWKSNDPQVGKGKLSITESIPGKQVMTSIEFGGFDRAAAAGWDLAENKDGTTVLWHMESELSHNPVNRWFGLFLDKMIGPDFENGLSQLKTKIENGSLHLQQPTMTLERQLRPAMLVLTIMDTAQTTGDIGPKLQKAYGEMGAFIKAAGLNMQGPPMSWYYSAGDPFIIEPALIVDKMPANTAGRIHIRKVTATNVVIVHYFGPYELSSLAYTKISVFLKENNLVAKSAPYEMYVDDRTTKKTMFEVRTDIVQPIN